MIIIGYQGIGLTLGPVNEDYKLVLIKGNKL